MSTRAADAGVALRAEAVRANVRVVRDRMSLEPALAAGESSVAARDVPLLRALVTASLRWHHRLVWQIDRVVTRPLKPRDAELAALLRIGLSQLEWLRVPDHAAVSTTVDATGPLGLAHARGLVNAVLRRFLRERAELEELAQTVLEAKYSHPRWLVERLEADWPVEWPAILEANNEQAPMWLRVNRRRIEPSSYLVRLAADGIDATPSFVVPEALCLAEPRPTDTLPGFAEGLVSVQDHSAQRAAALLGAAPGMRVLDACAAPGGKTAHVLETCAAPMSLIALDEDAARLDTVARNLARLGLSATLRHADAAAIETWWDGIAFDRILLDAPCSAIGVIRRHPDIKVLRRPSDVAGAVARQARLLRGLWRTLAPGGRLLYATCTVLADENDAQIDTFLADTPDAELVPIGDRRSLTLLPGEAHGDGFHYACLGKLDPK